VIGGYCGRIRSPNSDAHILTVCMTPDVIKCQHRRKVLQSSAEVCDHLQLQRLIISMRPSVWINKTEGSGCQGGTYLSGDRIDSDSLCMDQHE
jgi:hypothetical protein